MKLFIPVDILPGIIALIIAFGQLLGPFKGRKILFSLFLVEIACLHISRNIFTGSMLFHYVLISQPVLMSIGVVIYLYIKSLTGDESSFSRRTMVHFIPSAVCTACVAGLYLLVDDLSILMSGSLPVLRLRLFYICGWIHAGIYVGMSITVLSGSIKNRKHLHKAFRYLLILLLVFFPTVLTGGVAVYWNSPVNIYLNYINMSLITFALMGLYGLVQRYPFFLQYGVIAAEEKTKTEMDINSRINSILGINLKSVMEEEKLFCDEDLSLSRLSDVLDVSPRQLSRYINCNYNMNYNTFINDYRIEESKKMLLTQPGRSILDIANSVGFNSYSVFYTAFREKTSLSPAGYRKKYNRRDVNVS